MSVVEEIKERLDLTDYVRRYVNLKKAGRNFKGLCPFHNEKTPSFFVFPESQHWRCFGCQRHGDIFSFAMEYNGWDFRTALEELGRLAGVEVRKMTPEQVRAGEEKERLMHLLHEAAEYYHHLLRTAPQAQAARAYLERRGFTQQTIDEFKLGYSLPAWEALRSHLLTRGFTVAEMLKAGMLVERERGGTYDRFRDRVMIPIRDRKGRIVAFGGRVLSPDAQPKYMNSPQTVLFDKSRILFGFDKALRAIRENDAAVIVEGYMDVMIPHQAGYRNVVAPMGTALTESHLRQLHRLTRRIILALDPDAAGIHATMRSVETAREALERRWEPVFNAHGLIGYEGRLDVEIRVALLPDGLDPDELILQDPARWERIIAAAEPIVRFYFHQLLQQENPREPKGKARIVEAMLPLLQDIPNPVEREAYAQEIAMRLGLDPVLLLDQLRARERVNQVHRRQVVERTRPLLAEEPQAFLLKVLLHYPHLLESLDISLVRDELHPVEDEDFDGPYRFIWNAWLETLADPGVELDDLLPDDLAAQVRQWLNTPLPEASEALWLREVRRALLQRRQSSLRETMRQFHLLLLDGPGEAREPIDETLLSRLNELRERLRRIQYVLAKTLNPRLERRTYGG